MIDSCPSYSGGCDMGIERYLTWDDKYGDYVIKFGEHDGKHLSTVIKDNCGYIDWMLYKADFPEAVTKIVADIMEEMQNTGEI
jgi:hypothetical protein